MSFHSAHFIHADSYRELEFAAAKMEGTGRPQGSGATLSGPVGEGSKLGRFTLAG